MFAHIFNVLIRVVALPVIAIWTLVNVMGVGDQAALLGVAIVLTIITIPLTLWHLIKVVPNLALFRTMRVLKLILEVIIEVAAVITYWVIYINISAAM